ncbi:serine hydrolase [Thermomicrobiaceae bacterium CFH 74404]|uniref:Serine hydrolase n=1 Tax=Thermalbibacter longus TaxID=2951981 RepID=A0AA42B906_9BACT|nr:serine hydrolase [Thermalbibacter longus]MCM8747661.1 serine hydrolase [Thermalbibacter longus]
MWSSSEAGGSWRHVVTALDPPQLTARAAIAVDLTNQALLYADNPDAPLPPASTAKIVTALVVAGTLDLDEVVEIQPGDLVDPAVYANMGLAAGDRLTVEGLLTGLLVASAGDAANALARAAGQRLGAPTDAAAHQRFVAEMNRLARKLGMRRSWFVAPDGRDMPGQVVTARDLAIATEALFQEPVLERIVSFPTATVRVEGPNPREVTLYSTNQWLGLPGVHGVKTGTTPAAGQCLVAAVWRGDARVVTVVLGSQDRYADTQALLDWLDRHLAWVRVAPDGGFAPLDAALRERGLTLATSRTLLLTREDAATLEVRLEALPSSTGRAQWQQGTVVLLVRGQEVLSLPLYAADRFAPVS